MKLLLAFALLASSAFAADLTGTWNAAVETDMGSGTPIFELKQTGDKLTGTYNGQLGTAKLTGTVQGKKVEWTFSIDVGGETAAVKYVGTLESDTHLKGAVTMGSAAKGTFTADKK